MKQHILTNCLLAAIVTVSAGCGTTPQDRGLSGAGIGAGAGAIIGAVTGLSVLEAAALGAVGGGLTGALTNRSQIDMGEPVWKRTAQTQAPSPGPQQDLNGLIFDVQSRLAAQGYDPGPIDGVIGAHTRQAIRAYQRDRGMPIDGQVTPALVTSLRG